MITILAIVVAALIGFGLGRIKNAQKLAAVREELTLVRKNLVAAVRSKI
jgi:hypothetical protein